MSRRSVLDPSLGPDNDLTRGSTATFVVNSGIALAFGAPLLYGGWVVAAGVARRSLSPVNAVLFSSVASLVVGVYVFEAPLDSTNVVGVVMAVVAVVLIAS